MLSFVASCFQLLCSVTNNKASDSLAYYVVAGESQGQRTTKLSDTIKECSVCDMVSSSLIILSYVEQKNQMMKCQGDRN